MATKTVETRVLTHDVYLPFMPDHALPIADSPAADQEHALYFASLPESYRQEVLALMAEIEGDG